MLGPAIEVYKLVKTFSDTPVVNGVSFVIERGATCALIGANGAGKTTTLAMLLGLVTPSSGRITVLGHDLRRERYMALARMNFFSAQVELPQRLTVYENLSVYARLYGVPFVRRRLAELAEDLDIGELLNRQYGSLSTGHKNRVLLAKALLNQPELVLLDEPTATLDPDTADRLRQFVQRYQRTTGATVLFTSNNMAEVERFSSGVLVMRAGSLVASGTAASLTQQYGRTGLEQVFLDIVRGTRAPTPASVPVPVPESVPAPLAAPDQPAD